MPCSYHRAGMLVIPADVQNPGGHLEALAASLPLPPLMQADVMPPFRDKDFPRHIVLLLDVATGMSEKRCAPRGCVTCAARRVRAVLQRGAL
jgi:hypothetical protein